MTWWTLWVLSGPPAWAASPDELARLAASLQLTIEVAVTEVSAGQDFDVEFVVTNIGRDRVEGCLGKDFSFSFDAEGLWSATEGISSHPACETPFRLRPGAHVKVSKTQRAPTLGDCPDAREVELRGSVFVQGTPNDEEFGAGWPQVPLVAVTPGPTIRVVP